MSSPGGMTFRPFSFDAASQYSPSACLQAHQEVLDVSPMSTSATPPPEQTRLPTPPPCTVGELTHKLRQQNLCVDVNAPFRTPLYEPLTPPSDDIAFPISFVHVSREASLTSMSPGAIRAQRQANTQLQCSESHIRDISALVEKMIEQRDQCSVYEAPTSSPLPIRSSVEAEEEDEGVDMEYDAPALDRPFGFPLKFRRSGDRLNGQTSVCKSVRMRKSKVTKRRSSR